MYSGAAVSRRLGQSPSRVRICFAGRAFVPKRRASVSGDVSKLCRRSEKRVASTFLEATTKQATHVSMLQLVSFHSAAFFADPGVF